MALITCTECGKEFSDKASACPNCGCPTSEIINTNSEEKPKEYSAFHKFLYGNNANAKEAWNNSGKYNSGQLCPKCHGTHIKYDIQSVQTQTKGKSEVRDKSALTKVGNKMGRAAMIGMTGGLWALTPKKSDKKEVQKSKTKIINNKIAICQDCGNIWNIL